MKKNMLEPNGKLNQTQGIPKILSVALQTSKLITGNPYKLQTSIWPVSDSMPLLSTCHIQVADSNKNVLSPIFHGEKKYHGTAWFMRPSQDNKIDEHTWEICRFTLLSLLIDYYCFVQCPAHEVFHQNNAI